LIVAEVLGYDPDEDDPDYFDDWAERVEAAASR
jgi:hypothetical protein